MGDLQITRTARLVGWIGNRIGKPPGWERIARRLAPPGSFSPSVELCVVRDGLVFFAQPGLPLGWHIALFGAYEPEIRSIISGLLRPGGVALDIGANVGWHTVLMGKMAGEAGSVLAIEANPALQERLHRHIRINRLGSVKIIACAAGNREGEVAFLRVSEDDPRSADGHVVAAGEHGAGQSAETVTVPMKRVDKLVEEAALERLELIKIDVEGSEWPVLQGASATLERFRPHVIFEYNAEYAHRGGGTPALLSDYFAQHRYQLFAIGRDWAEPIDSSWPPSANIWAVPAA